MYKKIMKNLASFSVVDIVIILAVFIGITTLVLFKFPAFNNNVLLTNTAYDVSLSVNEVQSLASGGSGGDIDVGFGLYIDVTDDNDSYIIFEDTDGDYLYRPSSDKLLETIDLREGHIFKAVCSSSFCAPPKNARLHIVFNESDIDTSIRFTRPSIPTPYKEVEIFISSTQAGQGRDIKIYINSTGVIDIEGCDDNDDFLGCSEIFTGS
jgi:acetone carboxylase gamma subunit